MQQLSGIDAGFLSMETSRQYGHVSSMILVDPSTGSGDVYGDARKVFEERLHLMEVYRRKLVEVPFGLDLPYWVEDPDLDLDFHLREIALPEPGDDRQLGEQVARIVARPLDRTRPLWEWYVITGLRSGLAAVLTKVHHATIDGVSGVELLSVMMDTEPGGRTVDPPPRRGRAEATPSNLDLLARTVASYATRPRKVLRLQVQIIRTLADLSGNPAARQTARAIVPGLRRLRLLPPSSRPPQPNLPSRPAPRTPFNRSISPHRRFAFRSLPFDDARTIKSAFGVTVNDVVMALCAGALRRYLLDHDALPDDPLIAMVPVSVREPGDETYTNRVTGVVASLHTDRADAADRLRRIHGSMAAAKELQQAVPATILSDVAHFLPPAVAAQAARLATSTRIADRMNPPVNVTISNVPGPRQPLYLSGAEMRHFYPVSTIVEGQGLNMTVQSYLGNLDFGFLACRELMPDVWDLCDHLGDAMDELLAAAKEA